MAIKGVFCIAHKTIADYAEIEYGRLPL